MDAGTVVVYEQQAAEWRRRRGMRSTDAARAFADRCLDGPRIDVGCGPGRFTPSLGEPVVALDAAYAMLELVGDAAPGALRVHADLEYLPLRDRSLAGAWAVSSYVHVPRDRLPLALARLHWALRVDAPLYLSMFHGAYEGSQLPGDDFPGRFFAQWDPEMLTDVVVGAGFTVERCERDGDRLIVQGRRAHSLPDTVARGMRVLVCGLNPSRYSADRGVGFARPGNRFWKAAIASGLVTRERDTLHALRAHGVGLTDLVKRATVAASELSRAEYREGFARVERLVRWLQPAAVCFVGLDGWRAAVDRNAVAGWQPSIAGVPAYVMPSTSGLNARTPLAALTEHLRAVRSTT